MWPDRSAAEAAGDAAAGSVATDSAANQPLLAYFREPPKQPPAAAEPAFWSWAETHGGDRTSVAGRVRRAYGQAYVSALKTVPVAGQDPIDQPLAKAINDMHWRMAPPTSGQIVSRPRLPEGTDPPLKTAAGPNLIQFMRDIAETRASGGYSVERLGWAWRNHPPSHGYLEDKFRGANGGDQHEWIPTNMFLDVVNRAVLATGFAPSGTRLGVQWINLFHNLRTDTHRVYFRVLRTPEYHDETTVGTRQVADARVGIHSGAAFNAPTGNSGAGMIGQADFHAALRAEFTRVPLTTPLDYIQSLLWVVAGVIWDGDLAGTGVPSPVWGAPLAIWFQVPGAARQSGLTLIDLAARQQENINVIDADFNNARATLG